MGTLTHLIHTGLICQPHYYHMLLTGAQVGLWVGISCSVFVLQVALSEVCASCILCITGGQLVLWVALSEVRASCILCITGGQLGLWVGISVITICELLDLMAQLVTSFCTWGGGRVNQDKTTGKYFETADLSSKKVIKDPVQAFYGTGFLQNAS